MQRLSPRPTIVFTLSELDDDATAINEIIRALPGSFRNVVVVDWAEATEANPELLADQDRPQLTGQGSEVLVLYTAAALGKTPAGEQGVSGECLPSVFVDDSAIVLVDRRAQLAAQSRDARKVAHDRERHQHGDDRCVGPRRNRESPSAAGRPAT